MAKVTTPKSTSLLPFMPDLAEKSGNHKQGANGFLQRPLTKKEEYRLRDPKGSRRVRYHLLRRADDDLNVVPGRLRDALHKKIELFGHRPLHHTGGVYRWLPVGPRNINGRIKCLAIHPANGQILYAGSASGGVWKTIDGGQSWMPTMHDEESLAIGALAIDPNAHDTIYAGTGEPFYYISRLTGEPALPGSIDLSWYYEGVGVYKSVDGGDSWTLTGPVENEFVYAIAVDPNNSANVLCAGYSYDTGRGGLCRSTDGGATWTTIAGGIYTAVVFDANNAGVAYAAQYNGGIHKSLDSGATWARRNTGLPDVARLGRISLTIARSNSNVLYAQIEDDESGSMLGVYRTGSAAEAPGGWTQVTRPPGRGGLSWGSHINADPSDVTGDIVWSGSFETSRSEDGGMTWRLMTDMGWGTLQITHVDQQDLAFDPANSNIVYAANDGGVFRGEYVGGAAPMNWVKRSTGLAVTQFYDLAISPASPTMFGGGAQDNGTLISTGGLSWHSVLRGDGGYVAFHPTDPYRMYAQYTGATMHRSTDGGNYFGMIVTGITERAESIFPATVLTLDNNAPDTLFCGTLRVFRTTNAGDLWVPVTDYIGAVTEITIAPSTSAVIYAGTLGGRLYRATDGGISNTSFVDITPTVSGWPRRWLAGIAAHPADSGIVYVCFLGFNNLPGGISNHVWKGVWNATASAWTWTMISNGLPNVPVSAIVIHPDTLDLYAATEVGVFHSHDDGANWNAFDDGLPNAPVVDLALDPTRNELKCATHGRGMYEVKLGAPTPQYDIYLRDNVLDTGETVPSPSGVPDPRQPGEVVRHYQSADIKVDAPPFDAIDGLIDGVEFDNPRHNRLFLYDDPVPEDRTKMEHVSGIEHDRPIRGETNRVYVQIHNRGWGAVPSVTVKLLWTDAGAALPALPADYWSNFPGDGFDQTRWEPIGTMTITDLLPNTPRVLMFEWECPTTTSDHVCLLAMIDSPNDSLLPQTELNVDILTRSSKHVTHRNVSPITVARRRSAPARAWTSLNFNNGFNEPGFFDLVAENISDPDARIRMILPRVRLANDIAESVDGASIKELSTGELAAMVERARSDGSIPVYVQRLVADMPEPVMLTLNPGAKRIAIRNVLIAGSGSVPAAFVVSTQSNPSGDVSVKFEVNQYARGVLIGGNQIVMETPRQTAIGSEQSLRRLRIVLERVQIIDDHDPWIKGRGEFFFTAEVTVNDDPVRGGRWLVPQTGSLKISDRPGRNVVEIEQAIFDGAVGAGDRLRVSLLATELDLFTRDDTAMRYSRLFKGDPSRWVGSYAPDDEPNDPEHLRDWKVWYRIEEV